MASYPAPTETLPIFSPSVFDVNDVPLTITEGEKYFITYPTAQGAITIPTLNTGTLNVSGAIGTTSITAGSITLSGALDITNPSTNLIYGNGALPSITTGITNLAIGNNAGASIDIGSSNTIIGNDAGDGIIAGNNITLVGVGAGQALDLGSNSTGVGYSALANVSGSNNTAVGYLAGNSIDTGTNNTCIGAGSNCSAGVGGSTAIGVNASATASNQIVLGTTSTTIQYNKVSPLYTTLSLVTTNIGYSYNPTITIALAAGDIATQNVPVGVWAINYFIFLAGATATNLSIRDATSGGGTELARSYVSSNSYSGTAVLAVLTGTKTICINQVGASATAGTGTQRFTITRIA